MKRVLVLLLFLLSSVPGLSRAGTDNWTISFASCPSGGPSGWSHTPGADPFTGANNWATAYNSVCAAWECYLYSVTNVGAISGVGTASGSSLITFGGSNKGGGICPSLPPTQNSNLSITISCSSGKVLNTSGVCVESTPAGCEVAEGTVKRVTVYAGRLNDLYPSDQDLSELARNLYRSPIDVDGCRYVAAPEVVDPDVDCSYAAEGIVDLRVYCDITLRQENAEAEPDDLKESDKSEGVCPPDHDTGTVNGIPRCLPRSGAAPAPLPLKETSKTTRTENDDGTVTEETVTVSPGGTVSVTRVTTDPVTSSVVETSHAVGFAPGTPEGAVEEAYDAGEGVSGGSGGNQAPVSSVSLSSFLPDALAKPRWWDSSCFEDDEIDVYGHTLVIPWSGLCGPLDLVGRMFVVLSLLWAAGFVIKGIK